MFWQKKRDARPAKDPARQTLRVEILEDRHMLSGGMVQLAVVGANLDVTAYNADPNNKTVQIQSTGNPGEYLVTGGSDGTTLVQGATQAAQITVEGVTGGVTVDLGQGYNSFTVAAPASGQKTAIPGSLSITTHSGGGPNVLQDLNLGGALMVTRNDPGDLNLSLTRVVVNGSTYISSAGGAGGSAEITALNSTFIGTGGTGAFNNTALGVSNFGTGSSTLKFVTCTFGSYPVNWPEVVIQNGQGVNSVTFTGTPGTGNGTLVYGSVYINNGGPAILLPSTTYNLTSVINTNILGGLTVYNNQNGSTPVAAQTNILNSQIGSSQYSYYGTNAQQIGGPLQIFNAQGYDTLTMTGSQAYWGMLVQNGGAQQSYNAPSVGPGAWGSYGNITNSQIGGAANAYVNGPYALYMLGDNGPNTLSMGNSTVVGTANISLGAGNAPIWNGGLNPSGYTAPGIGNNTVTLGNSNLGSLLVSTGAGPDSVSVSGGSITAMLDLQLGDGNDRAKFVNSAVLPTFLVGDTIIQGGNGLNTFYYDTNVTPNPVTGFLGTWMFGNWS